MKKVLYEISNINEFIDKYNDLHPKSNFFSKDTMKFFGDTVKNYGIVLTELWNGNGYKKVYELFRKKPVKHGLTKSVFFEFDTLERIIYLHPCYKTTG